MVNKLLQQQNNNKMKNAIFSNLKKNDKVFFTQQINCSVFKIEDKKLINIFSGAVTPKKGDSIDLEFIKLAKNKNQGLFRCLDEGYIYRLGKTGVNKKGQIKDA